MIPSREISKIFSSMLTKIKLMGRNRPVDGLAVRVHAIETFLDENWGKNADRKSKDGVQDKECKGSESDKEESRTEIKGDKG